MFLVCSYVLLLSVFLFLPDLIFFFYFHRSFVAAIGCRDIDVLPPENGKRVANDFSVGSTVTFSCNQGYELIGDTVSTCQTDRQWSRMVPICKGMTSQLMLSLIGRGLGA